MPPKTEEKRRKITSRHLGRILIVCEGRETEFNYFNEFKQILNSFRKSNADDMIVLDVKSVGNKTTANQIVERAEKEKASATLDYLEIWCVFDKDNDGQNSPEDYNKIIATDAKNLGFKVAYSNPSFELWLLLHFHYHDTQLPYKDCCIDELAKCLGKTYVKADTQLFDGLKEKQSEAIRNAARLRKMWKDKKFAKHNPSTTVHELVTRLNNYLKQVEGMVSNNN